MKERDNLFETVNELAAMLELPEIVKADIKALHRLPARAGKIPVVLMRFTSRASRERWINKNSSSREIKSNIRLFENLTAVSKKLLWLTKQKAEEQGYQFTWQKTWKCVCS